MKIVYALDGDVSLPVVHTPGDEALIAAELPDVCGVGTAFYAFTDATLPDGVEANPAWDAAGAPTVSATASENQSAIDAMLANPPLDKVWSAVAARRR